MMAEQVLISTIKHDRESLTEEEFPKGILNADTLLKCCINGDIYAENLLWGMIYKNIERIALRYMSNERDRVLLTANDLVHEAYVRIKKSPHSKIRDLNHLSAFISLVMRRVLIDHSRHRSSSRYSHGKLSIPIEYIESIDVADPATSITNVNELIDLSNALEKLERVNMTWATVIECKYFGGFKIKEIAVIVDANPRKVKSILLAARNWLRESLGHRAN